jgi:hypothetical protein
VAIKKILEAIFEQDFIDTSYGFHPARICESDVTGIQRNQYLIIHGASRQSSRESQSLAGTESPQVPQMREVPQAPDTIPVTVFIY